MNFVKRIPIFPTLLVLAAVAIMIRLGFWQLDRMHQKEALLAQYAAADGQPPIMDLSPYQDGGYVQIAFRHIRIECTKLVTVSPMAGHNRAGTTGWAQVAICSEPTIPHTERQTKFCFDDCPSTKVSVSLGWSAEPKPVQWSGGWISGILAPAQKGELRIIADPPLAGLERNAKPDPKDVPNNHLSYAVQWFLFALTALVIYGLALRKRLSA